MIDIFKDSIRKKVERLFLIVWPPLGEDDIKNVDISIGFVFTEDSRNLYVVSTDASDNWTPIISKDKIPKNIHSWIEFKQRIKRWMNSEINDDLEREYYELTDANEFSEIVHNTINDVEFIRVGTTSPFGVRLVFDKDFVQSTPISDGNTIETKFFNQNNNIDHFKNLGTIHFEGLITTSQ